MRYTAGQSAVVVPVAAVEALVGPWRERFDLSARQGMPAHVTALFPFLDGWLIDDAVIERLRALCAEVAPIDVAFSRVERFPVSAYLAPDPADELRRLTEAIFATWPDTPPYGGVHDTVIPHLTVAFSTETATLDEVERSVRPELPLHARLTEAALFSFDGARWQRRARLPFQAAQRP